MVLMSTPSSDFRAQVLLSEGQFPCRDYVLFHKTIVVLITYHCCNFTFVCGIIWLIPVFLSKQYLFLLNFCELSTTFSMWLAQNTYLLNE